MKFIIILTIQLFLVSYILFSQNIHPNFNISHSELTILLKNEPIDIANKILNNEYNFLDLILNELEDYEFQLVLVDKNNRLDPNFVPDNLVNLSNYNLHTRFKTMLFVENGIFDFVKMSNDAKSEGIDIFIASTYRDYAFQKQIFTNMKNFHGEEKAATIVAYPGASQHQTGTAVDFGSITESYAYTDAGKWLTKNAWKYGFSLSYPKGKEELTTYIWEPWHYRYLGKNALIIQRTFFKDLQQNFLVFWNKYNLFFKEKHIQ